MSQTASPSPQFTPFQVHVVSSTQKLKSSDSPTASILKTPTAIFVNSRTSTKRSSSKTKKLKFANGPVDLETLRQFREGSQDSVSSAGSSIGGDIKQTNGHGQIDADGNLVEVAISPIKRMKVSPESWTAFLAYKKYDDYANEAEKTDYTYSRLSKFRHKEIIPGFPVRPNLSRSPISRSTNTSKSYNFSYASDSYIKSFFDKSGLRHRARQLNLDSEDETDISTTQYRYQERVHVRLYRTITRSLVAIYTSILYYLAVSTSTIKDFFSRHLLRRSSYTSKFSSGSSAFWIPWSTEGKYASPIYLAGSSSSSYYHSFRSAIYKLYERVTTIIYASSHNSIEYVKVKYSKSSRRRKILWFLIPLLLLAGLQLARSDSFPNPDAILNTVYNSVASIPSYLHHFFIVSIPHFLIKTIPCFLFTGIPHFFTDTLPSFITETIPKGFWSGFEYLKNISNINFFGFLSGFFDGFKYYVSTSAESVFNFFVHYLSVGYAYSSNLLIVFYSYFCTLFYDFISGVLNWISYFYDSIWAGISLAYNAVVNYLAYFYSLLVFSLFYTLDGAYYVYEVVSGNLINSGKWLYGSVVDGADSVYSSVANFFENEEIQEVKEKVKEEVNASVVVDKKAE